MRILKDRCEEAPSATSAGKRDRRERGREKTGASGELRIDHPP